MATSTVTPKRKAELKDALSKATKYWVNSQVAAGRTISQIESDYQTDEVRDQIVESAKRLAK